MLETVWFPPLPIETPTINMVLVAEGETVWLQVKEDMFCPLPEPAKSKDMTPSASHGNTQIRNRIKKYDAHSFIWPTF